MAYGTPRAIEKGAQHFYCIGCTLELVETGAIVPRSTKLSLQDYVSGYHTLVNWEGEHFEPTRLFVEALLSKDVLEVDRVLVEGQPPDQHILEEFACAKCGKLLREFCTDY